MDPNPNDSENSQNICRFVIRGKVRDFLDLNFTFNLQLYFLHVWFHIFWLNHLAPITEKDLTPSSFTEYILILSVTRIKDHEISRKPYLWSHYI